jgi:hypothetical protein
LIGVLGNYPQRAFANGSRCAKHTHPAWCGDGDGDHAGVAVHPMMLAKVQANV